VTGSEEIMSRIIRIIAAALVLGAGLVHLELYFSGYRSVPNANLGRSFILNAVAAAVIAIALVARPDKLIRVAGIAYAAGTLGAFALSRTDKGIFGFTEHGLNPTPRGAIALICEIGAIVLLVLTFVLDRRVATADRPPERPLPLAWVAGVAVVVAAIFIVAGAAWSNKYDNGSTVTAGGSGAATNDSTGTNGGSAAGKEAVTIKSFAFNPPDIDVKVGQTVTWTNQDGFDHSVVADDGSFKSDPLGQNATFSQTFDTAGTFTYACGIHPSMKAKVVVAG
jgi:plastocyanin